MASKKITKNNIDKTSKEWKVYIKENIDNAVYQLTKSKLLTPKFKTSKDNSYCRIQDLIDVLQPLADKHFDVDDFNFNVETLPTETEVDKYLEKEFINEQNWKAEVEQMKKEAVLEILRSIPKAELKAIFNED